MRPRWVLLAVLLPAADLPAEPPKPALPEGAILRLGTDAARPPTAVAFAEGGKAIYTGTDDELCRCDATTGKQTTRRKAEAASLAVSPDGDYLATVGPISDKASVWKLPSLEKTGRPGESVLVRAEPSRLSASAGAFFVTHADTIVPHGWAKPDIGLKPFRPLEVDGARTMTGVHFAPAPDGRSGVLAGVTKDGPQLVWWDFAAGKVTRRRTNGRPPKREAKEKAPDPADAPAFPLAFVPNGRLLVAESEYGFLLLSGDTGERVRTLCPRWRLAVARPAPRGYVDWRIPFALSPDGRLLAVGRDRGILLIEVVSGCIRWSFDPGERVTALAFSPDGARLASGGDGDSTLVWDVYAADGRPADVSQLKSERVSAHQAIATLLRQPAALVAVAKTLPAVMTLDAAQIHRWLTDLDNARYVVRETAQAGLAKLPLEVRPTIEAYLKTPGLSAEAVARAERARDALPAPPVAEDLWRVSRILEMLERLNTPDARAEMTRLAAGEQGYALTVEAAESLARMAKRAK